MKVHQFIENLINSRNRPTSKQDNPKIHQPQGEHKWQIESKVQTRSIGQDRTNGTGLHKTGIRGIQDTRQIVDGKTDDKENNDKKGGS